MNIKMAIATCSLLTVVSFSSVAASAISSQTAQSREAIGSVTLSAVNTSPMDLRMALNKKAEQQGASAYHVIEAREGNNWHVTAELYK